MADWLLHSRVTTFLSHDHPHSSLWPLLSSISPLFDTFVHITGATVHGDPFPGGRVLVLLGDHRHRPRAAPTALPRRIGLLFAMPFHAFFGSRDDDVVYGGRVLSFRQSAVVSAYHRTIGGGNCPG